MERVQKIRDMGMRELSVLEKQVSIEREKMIQMEQLADRVRLLEEEITGLKNDADALDAKVADGEEQLCQLEQDVRVVTEEREKVMLNLESCTEEIRSKEQQISRAKEDMVRAFQEVESYEMSGRQSDLLRLIERGTQLEGKVQELRVIRKDVDSHFQATNKTLAEQESRKRNILDNIKFRKLTSEIDSLALEIEAYNRKANEVSGGTDLIKSLSTIEKQLMEANAIKSSLVGSRHIVSRTRQEKERELRERDEDGLRKDYNALLVEKKTLELSVSELERYQRALDQALMAYHAIKMHDINKILRELWATTYRGNDIDTIEIVSDVETAESSNVRRSYNYRVVMHRGDAILDMRGRCSAGQKVLACLVIRLALAESFCLDCGILALDEPTTNLDALNIESLAASLAEIIRHRRQQRNFQLLVITHDERFIELLGARDVVDDYYLVKKDDRGLSRIFKQSLRKL
uniref:DNA repair protein RAD50 n=2 Tax=Compsopogon caeruleus TaxID=31354 RepID=A0A7S1TEJ3_9RHOD|mmetsp:Transcript_3643/g.6933  ORF Transcript_3643/g.6933 Transcript_3643/m.6933 type:complete len:463 (+) Transcript_3643:238-1626(+)